MALSVIPDRDIQINQSSVPSIIKEEDVMAQICVPGIDSVVCHEVTSLVSCTLDELLQRLPAYSWSQVFASVDRLSRLGTLRLSRRSRFGYVLSVGSDPPIPNLRNSSRGRLCVGETAEATLTGT